MVLKWTRTKPEPQKHFEQELNLNPNRYLKRFDTLITAFVQSRQIVDKTLGMKPFMMKWIYTAMIRPIMPYSCVPWAGGINKKYRVRKLTKVQRLACLMISSAFPGTFTGALEILFNITPIEEYLLAEAVRGSYRIIVSELWHVNRYGSFGKAKSHVDVCNETRRFLPLLQCELTEERKQRFSKKILNAKLWIKRCYQIWKRSKSEHCQGLHRWLETKWKSRCGFLMQNTQTTLQNKHFFTFGIYSTVFQA